MSEYQFKVGDKVKYKSDQYQAAINNGHDPYKVYTICMIGISASVYFEGEDCCCFISRLEPVKESTTETFDYRQALKILAENPEAEIESKSEDMDWDNILLGKEFILHMNAIYRLKPQPKKYQWLYKTKDGKYGVTYSEYSSKEEVEANCSSGCGEVFIKPLNEETL